MPGLVLNVQQNIIWTEAFKKEMDIELKWDRINAEKEANKPPAVASVPVAPDPRKQAAEIRNANYAMARLAEMKGKSPPTPVPVPPVSDRRRAEVKAGEKLLKTLKSEELRADPELAAAVATLRDRCRKIG